MIPVIDPISPMYTGDNNIHLVNGEPYVNIDKSSNDENIALSQSDALSKYAELAKSNPEYMDSYLQLLAERENTTQAQQWYEKMSGSQYSRAIEDIKSAGYNPYTVLNGLNGAGSGSVSAAGTSSISGFQNRTQKESNSIAIFRAIASVAGIALAIAAMA